MHATPHHVWPIVALTLALAGCGTPTGAHRGMPPGENDGHQSWEGSQTSISCQAATAPLQMQLQETASALALTPKQLVLWDRYQESVSALMADQMKASLDRPTMRGAMAQIQAKIDIVNNRLAALEEIADKAHQLYQSLETSQQKIADQRLANTVPTLYSSLSCQEGHNRRDDDRHDSGLDGPGAGMRRH